MREAAAPYPPPHERPSRPALRSHRLCREGTGADAIRELDAKRGAPAAPLFVDHDRFRLEHAVPARLQQTPEHVMVLGAAERRAGTEHLVEPADRIERVAPDGHVGAVSDVDGVRRACERAAPPSHNRHHRPCIVVRDDGTDRESDRRVLKASLEGRKPPGLRAAVVVGEGDDGSVGGAKTRVPSSRRTRLRATNDVGAGVRCCGGDPLVTGRRVGDDDGVAGAHRSPDRSERGGKLFGAVPGGHDNGKAGAVLRDVVGTMRRVRVLIVASWPPWPRTDGASLILAHQLRLLAGRHRLTVLAASRPPGAAQPPNREVGLADDIDVTWWGPPRSGLPEYATRRTLSLRSREPADVFRVHRRAFVREVVRLVQEDRPDVVHLHGWGTAPLVEHLDGVPAVHMPIDAWHEGAPVLEPQPWWRRLIEVGQAPKIRRHESRWYPRFHAVVVVAPRDAELITALAPTARVEVVRNGVEAGDAPAPASDEPVIGFHGSLSTWTNIDAATRVAVDILPRVREEVPGARALLVGRDPPPGLTRLAGPTVEVTGAVPDVRPHLERMAVYVAPLNTGTGIKNKVLEAMAAGRPVVSTGLGLSGIGPGDGVRLEDEPAAMAKSVIELLRDRALRTALGAEARRRVIRDFSWERSVDRLEQIWEDARRRT
jgi:polysaccharide biosynthesis protein PslH